MRPRHSNVGNIGSAAGQNLFVSGWHMGVSPADRRNTSVQMPAHQLFVAGGFGVEIAKSNHHVIRNFFQYFVYCGEGQSTGRM